uniref:Uncharacterized protein n=1 Tax=Knipowitschia caucasica TaxID=637954 RepID=A0AAV2LVR3_KNICA
MGWWGKGVVNGGKGGGGEREPQDNSRMGTAALQHADSSSASIRGARGRGSDGQLDAVNCKRVNVGGAQAAVYLQRLLQLKSPAHSAAITLSRMEELLHQHSYCALDYHHELEKWRSPEFYEREVHRMQLPFSMKTSAVSVEERKHQQLRRLQEVNHRRREERLQQDQERLEELLSVQRELFCYCTTDTGHQRELFCYCTTDSGHQRELFCYCRTDSGHQRELFCYCTTDTGHQRELFCYCTTDSGHQRELFCYCTTDSGHQRELFCYCTTDSGHQRELFCYCTTDSGHQRELFCYCRTDSGHQRELFCYCTTDSGHQRELFCYCTTDS